MVARGNLLTPAVILAAMILSMWNVGFFDFSRFAKSASNIFTFGSEMFPPNPAVVPSVSLAILETVQMAFLGTMLGFSFALPLAMLAARSLFGRLITTAVRLLLSVVRTVPALLWALILVVAVGLGPVAGTLGLAVYTLGYLGKLYYEAVEGVDKEVIEAVASVGCSKIQLVRYAILPESANHIMSQLLFMFEYNLRASSILGFVGAGGVGFYMLGYIQAFQYSNLLTIILLTLVTVLTMDFVSARIRSRYLTV